MLAGALLKPGVGSAAEEREKDEVEQFSELRGALEREEKMEQVASTCIVEVPIGHHTSGSPCIMVPYPHDSWFMFSVCSTILEQERSNISAPSTSDHYRM